MSLHWVDPDSRCYCHRSRHCAPRQSNLTASSNSPFSGSQPASQSAAVLFATCQPPPRLLKIKKHHHHVWWKTTMPAEDKKKNRKRHYAWCAPPCLAGSVCLAVPKEILLLRTRVANISRSSLILRKLIKGHIDFHFDLSEINFSSIFHISKTFLQFKFFWQKDCSAE